MRIRIIKDTYGIEKIIPYWQKWQSCPDNDYDQYKIVCKLSKEVVSPFIILIEESYTPIAILIARIETKKISPSIGYYKPIRLPAKIIRVLYQGWIGTFSEKASKMLIEKVWEILSAVNADYIVFDNLSNDSFLYKEIIEHKSNKFYKHSTIASLHWEMSLPSQPGVLIKKMKAKHRSWLRNREKKLSQAFFNNIEWNWIKNFDDINVICTKIENVAKYTYQRGLLVGFMNDRQTQEVFDSYSKRKQLRVFALEISNEFRAFWIGIIYKNVFHSIATGYDPDLKVYEPGTLILYKMIDELIKEKVNKIDFGLGDAYYKSRFGDLSWRETTIVFFNKTIKGLVIKLIFQTVLLIDEYLRKILNKLNLTDKVKRLWRETARKRS